jgi:ribosome-binding factor A
MRDERVRRINEEVRRIVSDIIRNDIKDPRVGGMVSIVRVDTSRDLRHAKLYISVLGEDNDGERTIEGLKKAAGFIRRELGNQMSAYYVPELTFVLDDSIEYSIDISQKINALNRDREET